jgi:hypothetical protein
MLVIRNVTLEVLAVVVIFAGTTSGCSETNCGRLYPPPAPVCGADLSMYEQQVFSEPQTPSQPLAFDACDNHMSMWLDFPPEANGGELLRSYWLTGTENLEVEVNLLGGADLTRRGRAWIGRVLLDGRPVPLASGGMEFTVQGNASVAKQTVVVDSSVVPDGAHTVVVLLTVEPTKADRKDGIAAIIDGAYKWSQTFTVLKNGTRFSPRPSPPAMRLPRMQQNQPQRTFVCSDCGPSAEGTLTVRFGVGDSSPRCPDESYGWTLIALLDGVEFPFGDLGFAPRFDVRGGEVAVFEVLFQGLPVNDGLMHSLLVYQLSDGRYTEAPQGYPSPWRKDISLLDAPVLTANWREAAKNNQPVPSAAGQ